MDVTNPNDPRLWRDARLAVQTCKVALADLSYCIEKLWSSESTDTKKDELHKLFLESQLHWQHLHEAVKVLQPTQMVDWRRALHPMAELERRRLVERGISLDDPAVSRFLANA